MAVLSDYTSGTITLANGSTAVTGTGTLFDVAKFREGDTLQIQNLTAVIASVDSNTQLTLTAPWTGTSLTGAPYRARYLPDGARVTAQATTLIELLGNGVLSNLAELGVEDGKTPVGNAAGEYELHDYLDDPNDTLAKFAALTVAARQIFQTDENGALKALALLANKFIYTDANKDLAQGDITPWAISMLGLTGTADRMPYLSAANSSALTPLTAFARSILDDGDASAVRGTIGAQANLGFTPINKGGDNNVGALTMGAGAAITWPLNNGSNNGIFLGPTTNDAGPSGATYTRGIVWGNPAAFRGRVFFEIQHGNYHGMVVAVETATGAPNRYFSLRSDGGFYAPGSINGTAKNFEIDHPSDPNNYDLRHCATEAPEMLVEYRGTARLVNGRATINVEEYFGVMPDTFSNLWADAWVTSLQNQDGFARLRPSRVNGVVFDIVCEDEASSDLVTWLVMARRNDPYVRWKDCNFTDDEGRLIIEFEKPE